MTQLERFVANLKELAKDAPPTIVRMPKNSVGLPTGSFTPSFLLTYIASCLEGKVVVA